MAHSSNKEYYEHLAAAVLEQYYSGEYGELIPQDKPDLRAGETLGVEVTQAMGNNEGKEFGLFRIVRGLKMSSIPERQLAAFERYGYDLIGFGEDRVVEGFIPSKASLSVDRVKKCFCNKLGKMKNYPEQMTVDLFVFAAFLECKGAEELQKLCAWCSNKQKANTRRTRYLYIFDYDQICRMNLDQQTISIQILNKGEISNLCERVYTQLEEREQRLEKG